MWESSESPPQLEKSYMLERTARELLQQQQSALKLPPDNIGSRRVPSGWASVSELEHVTGHPQEGHNIGLVSSGI